MVSCKNWERASDLRKPPLVVMWVCKWWSAATGDQARKSLASQVLLSNSTKQKPSATGVRKKSVLTHKPLPVKCNMRQRLVAAKELWGCCHRDVGTQSLPKTGASTGQRRNPQCPHREPCRQSAAAPCYHGEKCNQPCGERLRSAAPAEVGIGTVKKPSASQASRQAQQSLRSMGVQNPSFSPYQWGIHPSKQYKMAKHRTHDTQDKTDEADIVTVQGKRTPCRAAQRLYLGIVSQQLWKWGFVYQEGKCALVPKEGSQGRMWLACLNNSSGWRGSETHQVTNWVRC